VRVRVRVRVCVCVCVCVCEFRTCNDYESSLILLFSQSLDSVLRTS